MHSFKDIEAVFFDLDDTLYDQLSPFKCALEHCNSNISALDIEELFKKVRYFSDVLWKVYKKGEMSLELLRTERLRCAFKDFDIVLSNDEAKAIQDRYELEQHQIKAFPEVLSFMKDLLERNIVVGIMTNGPVKHQMNKIIALQVDQIIPQDRIFVSDGIGIAKPDKRVFDYVRSQINIDSKKCLYIGDTWENDIVPPIEAGWNCIWFNHRKRKQESHHSPTEIITNFSDFLSKWQ